MVKNLNLSNLAQVIGRLNIQEMHELFEILEGNYNVNIQSVLAFVPIPTKDSSPYYVGDIYPLDNSKGPLPTYQLVLKDSGRSKLQVLRTIKEITQLGLRESKELTDRAPSIICEVMDFAKAKEIQKAFEHIGAEMEIHQLS